MKRVFLTRRFTRWMSKTDLSVKALCKAVEEMEQGLIDANLGGGIIKNVSHYPAAARGAALAHWLRQTMPIDGSSYLALKKTNETI